MYNAISLIIPCYNEEESIDILYDELKKVTGKMPQYNFEFIFVDDGSKDKTLEKIKEKSALDGRIVYVEFSRNFGKESAMLAGFKAARGDVVAVIDADMQDPPSLLPEMMDILETGEYDSVATRRVSRKGEPKIRSFFARQFYKLINKITDVDIADGARDFRLMNRKMVDAMLEVEEYNRFTKGIFGWVGFKTKWYEFENVERAAGETKWSTWGLFKYALQGVINFSQSPLKAAAFLGIFFTFVSFLAIIFLMVRKFIWGDSTPGWPSLACIIVFVSGIQLFCIGIIGEYLAKTYMEVKKRPHYIVSDTNNEEIDRVG